VSHGVRRSITNHYKASGGNVTSIILGCTVFAANLQMINLKNAIAAVAFNVTLHVLTIPKYSYFGAQQLL
jgi:hypothetical protein